MENFQWQHAFALVGVTFAIAWALVRINTY